MISVFKVAQNNPYMASPETFENLPWLNHCKYSILNKQHLQNILKSFFSTKPDRSTVFETQVRNLGFVKGHWTDGYSYGARFSNSISRL